MTDRDRADSTRAERRRRGGVTLVLLLTLVAGACTDSTGSPTPPAAATPATPVAAKEAASWTIYRADSALRGVAPGVLAERLELAWTYETKGPVVSSPTVHEGVVYVGSSDGSIYALRLADGTLVWSYATDDFVEAPPLVFDGRVYVGSYDFNVYALDAKTGALVWKQELDDKIVGSANVAHAEDGAVRIIVGSYDARLYAFEPATGTKIWTYETENYINGTPAVSGDLIVFGGCDAALHVVSATTGKGREPIQLGPECHVAGSVALDRGKAYFGHYGNAFIAVDLEAREVDWVYPSERDAFFSSPSITGDRVVFGGRDRNLHCVARSDGAPLWTHATRRKVDGSPVVCGDKVVFGSTDGRVYLLRLEDGGELWTYEVGRSILSSPAVVDGMVVIGAGDGRVYAFRAAAEGSGR